MKYTVHYESKPGMWALYSGSKTVEADNEEDAIEKAYKIIRKTFLTGLEADGFLMLNLAA